MMVRNFFFSVLSYLSFHVSFINFLFQYKTRVFSCLFYQLPLPIQDPSLFMFLLSTSSSNTRPESFHVSFINFLFQYKTRVFSCFFYQLPLPIQDPSLFMSLLSTSSSNTKPEQQNEVQQNTLGAAGRCGSIFSIYQQTRYTETDKYSKGHVHKYEAGLWTFGNFLLHKNECVRKCCSQQKRAEKSSNYIIVTYSEKSSNYIIVTYSGGS